ncbi:MAG: hypothetical protein AAFQ94_03895 [Bacteroidota bacterium]
MHGNALNKNNFTRGEINMPSKRKHFTIPDNHKRFIDKTLKTISRPEDDTRPEQDRLSEALYILDWALDQAIESYQNMQLGQK